MTEAGPRIESVASWRALWLLLRIRLLRLRNQFSHVYNRPIGSLRSRAATRPKRRGSGVVTGFLALMMTVGFGTLSYTAMLNLQCAVGDPAGAGHCTGPQAPPASVPASDPTVLGMPLVHAVTVEAWLLFLVSVLAPLGARELSQSEWDLEWLATLPVSRTLLLWGRLLQRLIGNSMGWIGLLPLFTVVAWFCGLRWAALPAALGATLLLLSLSALLQNLVEVGLRLYLQPAQLKNLQAICSIITLPLLYLAISVGTGSGAVYVLPLIRWFPWWGLWSPPGLAVQALSQAHAATAWPLIVLLVAATLSAVAAGMHLLGYLLRNGIVAKGERESGGRRVRRTAGAPAAGVLGAMSAVQRRELRLLSRDRNFLVQSLFMPVIAVGSQLLLNGKLDLLLAGDSDPRITASMAFGLGSYVLMLSAFQTLNAEGGALWLLYTFPCAVETVLRDKARLWGAIAIPYALLVFGAGIRFSHGINPAYWLLAPLVLVGLPIYALIATSLGVFACNPQSQEARTRIRPTYAYLYMLLSGFYVYSLYSSQWWQKLVIMVLASALALALWQKARDQLPYILDPAASPAPRVSTADGLIAAMMFFIFQAIAILLVSGSRTPPGAFELTLSYSIAGALTYGLVRLVYWRAETRDAPVLFGSVSPGILLRGMGAALVATSFGLLYLIMLKSCDLAGPHGVAGLIGNRDWFFGLAVVAAPLFEEFIFRGLLFGGLRRSMGAWQAAAASAAVFAIVHPPVSMLPVFVLGLCAAFAYEITGTLMAPMLVHAIYNGAILTFDFAG